MDNPNANIDPQDNVRDLTQLSPEDLQGYDDFLAELDAQVYPTEP